MIKISISGFPWQKTGNHWMNQIDGTMYEKYGWSPLKVKGMGRFGGGWAISFGIQISSDFRDWIFNLIVGQIRIRFK